MYVQFRAKMAVWGVRGNFRPSTGSVYGRRRGAVHPFGAGMGSGAAAAAVFAADISVPAHNAGRFDPGIDHGNSDENVPYEFKKQLVFYRSQQSPGTIIIDTQERHLYLIQDPTHALRYGIGVGRDGFTWQGLLQ
jgi:lipoprotein-anchoring transpeptidase ErfK/SrfK